MAPHRAARPPRLKTSTAASRCSPPDVVEVDVDAVRGGRGQLLDDGAVVVVEARVEPVALGQQGDLGGRPGAADDPARPAQPGDLPDDGADGPGRPGHEDGVARLHPGHHEQADPGGHAGHAQHPEVHRGRQPRHLVDAAEAGGRALGDVAPAAVVADQVADGQVGRPGGDDPAHRPAGQRLAEPERRGVGLRVVHPAPHVRVDRDERVGHPHLALGQRRQLDLHQPEVLRHGPARGPGDQLPVVGDGGRGGAGHRWSSGRAACGTTDATPPQRASRLSTPEAK